MYIIRYRQTPLCTKVINLHSDERLLFLEKASLHRLQDTTSKSFLFFLFFFVFNKFI